MVYYYVARFGRLPALSWMSLTVLFSYWWQQNLCQMDLDFTSQSGTHTHTLLSFLCCLLVWQIWCTTCRCLWSLPSQGASTEASPFYGRHSQYGG